MFVAGLRQLQRDCVLLFRHLEVGALTNCVLPPHALNISWLSTVVLLPHPRDRADLLLEHIILLFNFFVVLLGFEEVLFVSGQYPVLYLQIFDPLYYPTKLLADIFVSSRTLLVYLHLPQVHLLPQLGGLNAVFLVLLEKPNLLTQ